VHKTTFVITPGTPHNSTQLSYSAHFFNTQDATLLRAFFLAMQTNRPTYVQSGCSNMRHYGLTAMARVCQCKRCGMA
jgi:hypothetical protein